MYPKLRNPIVTWLLTIITGGIYLLFWTARVVSELNSAERTRFFPIGLWKATAAALFFLAIVVAGFAIYSDSPILFLIALLFLPLFFLYIQISIGNYIKKRDVQLGTGRRFSNILSIFLFWIVAGIGIAYLQSGINRVTRHGQTYL